MLVWVGVWLCVSQVKWALVQVVVPSRTTTGRGRKRGLKMDGCKDLGGRKCCCFIQAKIERKIITLIFLTWTVLVRSWMSILDS